MTALPLNSGAYSAAGYIASAQRCVNLYPESTPTEVTPPVPVTHLLGPGLKPVVQLPDRAAVRGLYTATNGAVYIVCGTSLYWFDSGVTPVFLGSITQGTTPVRMSDNGTYLLIVDGSPNGYIVNLSGGFMQGITAAANSGTNGFVYYGADWVDYLDTFLLGNIPATPGFWASTSNGLGFDPLSFAQKSGRRDHIIAPVVLKRSIWLIGTQATELWFTAGGANFPFALLSGPYMEFGCVGLYALARCNNSVVWIGQNRDGQAVVYLGTDYNAERVSTSAIEQAWAKYPDLANAQGWAFQFGGHFFVGFRFPQSDKTWVIDLTTKQWHERETLDSDGLPHQWRVNCATFGNGKVFAGDFENGMIYEITSESLTDNEVPIQRLRSFPHQIAELRRITDWKFFLDMELGEPSDHLRENFYPTRLLYDSPTGPGDLLADGPVLLGQDEILLDYPIDLPPIINLRWSNTRGKSWESYVPRELGWTGEYKKILQWRRLGQGRDRVYEVSWTSPQVTALNGAWMDRQGASS